MDLAGTPVEYLPSLLLISGVIFGMLRPSRANSCISSSSSWILSSICFKTIHFIRLGFGGDEKGEREGIERVRYHRRRP